MVHSLFDPYWEVFGNNGFRPKVNKADFFRLTGYPFLNIINMPIVELLSDEIKELTLVTQLSYGQKALYYWTNLDSQVTNGGFVQLYYNGYGQYMPTVIKGLRHIGDKKVAELFQKGESIY